MMALESWEAKVKLHGCITTVSLKWVGRGAVAVTIRGTHGGYKMNLIKSFGKN
jgi:hypothetical protein